LIGLQSIDAGTYLRDLVAVLYPEFPDTPGPFVDTTDLRQLFPVDGLPDSVDQIGEDLWLCARPAASTPGGPEPSHLSATQFGYDPINDLSPSLSFPYLPSKHPKAVGYPM
jgi:hypothetical protein